MKSMVIIHHNDADGRLGGYILKKYFKLDEKYEKIKTIEANYNGTDLSSIEDGDDVAIVDYSLTRGELVQLVSKTHGKKIWIDHHRTAIKDYNNRSKEEKYFDDVLVFEGLAGCELAYLYAYSKIRKISFDDEFKSFTFMNKNGLRNTIDIDTFKCSIPFGIRLVGDYDTWRLEIPSSIDFAAGIKLYWDETDISEGIFNKFWDLIMEKDPFHIKKIIENGKIVNKLKDNDNATRIKKAASEVKLHKFENLKAIAVNSSNFSSFVFKTVHNDYEIGIVYSHSLKEGVMYFSIYRLGLNPEKNIDCGWIAKTYGGGGHPGAAGFRTSGTLPFKIVK